LTEEWKENGMVYHVKDDRDAAGYQQMKRFKAGILVNMIHF
jgi:hypothetical protein